MHRKADGSFRLEPCLPSIQARTRGSARRDAAAAGDNLAPNRCSSPVISAASVICFTPSGSRRTQLLHSRKSNSRERVAHKTETAPSAGWREVAAALHAPDAHATDVDSTIAATTEDATIIEGDREPSPTEVAG